MSSTPAHPWLRYRGPRIRRSDLRRSRFWLSLLAYFAVVAPVFWLLRPQRPHSEWLLLWTAFLFSLPLLANALRRLLDPAFYTGRQNDPPPRPLAEQFGIAAVAVILGTFILLIVLVIA